MDVRVEVGERMGKRLSDDPTLSNALLSDERMRTMEPHDLIATLAHLVLGQTAAIKFLAEQVQDFALTSRRRANTAPLRTSPV